MGVFSGKKQGFQCNYMYLTKKAGIHRVFVRSPYCLHTAFSAVTTRPSYTFRPSICSRRHGIFNANTFLTSLNFGVWLAEPNCVVSRNYKTSAAELPSEKRGEPNSDDVA